MANGMIGYRGVNTNRGPSPNIWGNCPMDQIRRGNGAWIDEDFDKGGLLTSATTIAALIGTPLSAFGSSGATQQYDDASGITLEESDNNESTNVFCEQHPFQISRSHGDLWFESRFKINSITTLEVSFFVGLMDTTTTTAAIPLTATGAIADINCIGFHKPEADTTTFDFSLKSDGVTAVAANDGAATIAAATYIKAGFRYSAQSGLVTSYINGAQQATQVVVNTGTPGASNGFTVTGGTYTAVGGFPNDAALGAVIAVSNGTNNTGNITVDWLRCYQIDV